MNELGRLFSADPVATQLFFGPALGGGPIPPEKELMLAVLADAVQCFCKHSAARDGAGTRLFREAQEWIFAEDQEQPFSFINVCEALSLNPNYIRRGMLEWQWRAPAERWDKKAVERDLFLKNVKRKLKKVSRSGKLAAARRSS
jgi:hypothetical protein